MSGDAAGVFRPLGDQAVRVEFGQDISPETNARVRRFCRALARDPIPGVVEWVPAYATVAVYYQPRAIRYDALCRDLGRRLAGAQEEALSPGRVVEIPVRYGGTAGPDLEAVAAHHNLTPAQIVAWHAGPTYLVYMLGFLPGFAYLGGLPPGLATPRRDTPRPRVPAGSVGIAGAQTGVYPIESPGGWQIIGRAELRLYDPERQPPALLRPGDQVRFIPQGRHDDH